VLLISEGQAGAALRGPRTGQACCRPRYGAFSAAARHARLADSCCAVRAGVTASAARGRGVTSARGQAAHRARHLADRCPCGAVVRHPQSSPWPSSAGLSEDA